MNLRFYLKELKVYILYKLKRPIPCAVEIRVTWRCNLKCYFCKLWRVKPELIKKEMSATQIFSLIDDLHRVGVPFVTITGGEALLRPDIEEIGLYLKKKGFVSTLSTNGTLVTPERAENLAKSYDLIRISIDGFGEAHSKIRGINKSYEMATRGLNYLLNAKGRTAKIGIHFVITKHNYQELNKLINLFKDKVDTFSVMPVFSDEGIEIDPETKRVWEKAHQSLKSYGISDQIDEYLENPSYETGKKYCEANRLYFAFNPDGKVTACSFKQYISGDLEKESFYSIWKKGVSKDVGEKIKNCSGCYVRCTTEMSMVFRKTPWELLKDSIKILKTYKI